MEKVFTAFVLLLSGLDVGKQDGCIREKSVDAALEGHSLVRFSFEPRYVLLLGDTYTLRTWIA